MNKMKFKRILAGLMSAAMVCSSLPAVFAESTFSGDSGLTTTSSSNSAIYATDFEDGVINFTGRGGNEVLEASSEVVHDGTYAMCVSGREKSWNGPQFLLDDLCEAGVEYNVSVWAKSEWYSTINLSMEYTDSEGTRHYSNLKSASGDQWAEFSNVKVSFTDDVTNVYVYIECTDATCKLYVDDFSLEQAPITPIQTDIPSLSEVYSPYFNIGTAIMASNLATPSFMNLVTKHFNESITFGNELKPDSVLNQAASQAYYTENGDDTNPQISLANAKSLLTYCSKNNIPVRGHCLVWHSQTPDWFFKEGFSNDGDWVSKEVMIQRMENYIKNVMEALATEYPDVNIYAWDVVNEAWTDSGTARTAGSNNTTSGNSAWVQVFGDNSFIKYAFEFARKYAPEGCKLYYNDYNEYMPQKTAAIVEMAEELKAEGLIDGIGMQSHLSTTFPTASAYESAVSKFAATGLDIQITELDITTSDTSESGFEAQAKAYSDIMDICVKYADSISAVIFWGVTDDQSWRATQYPLLFDSEYTAKPAYYSIIDGLEVPTTTEPTTTNETVWGDSNNDGSVDIADSILILQYISNSTDYPISAEGMINADVYLNGDGINAQDALSIQKLLAKQLTALPESFVSNEA